MKGVICNTSHVLFICDEYLVAPRLTTRRGAVSPLQAHQNSTPTLWLCAAFCRMCIPRTEGSTERFYQQSIYFASCLRVRFRRLHCDANPGLHILCDADARKCKELTKKWRPQVTASPSDFYSLLTDHSVCKDQCALGVHHQYGATGCHPVSVTCRPGGRE